MSASAARLARVASRERLRATSGPGPRRIKVKTTAAEQKSEACRIPLPRLCSTPMRRVYLHG
jgi:hypothetical protein